MPGPKTVRVPATLMRSLIYAVADLHGRLDLLLEAMRLIRAHAALNADTWTVIFLGDYCDRGPDSRGVIEEIMRLLATEPGGRVIALGGNHEELFAVGWECRFAGDFGMWLDVGGTATLKSYGGWEGVPEAHIAWISDLPLMARDDGGRVYVHAGLTPWMGVDHQDEQALKWIRGDFLRAPAPAFDVPHIVHGHTPTWDCKPFASRPELLSHRTNLDTGAYYTGVLKVGVFDAAESGGPYTFLTAEGPPR